MAIIVRRENPPLYSDYRKYKKHLRIDFNYCCIYCTVSEKEFGGSNNFSVEHLKPKSKFRELELDYSNLFYACMDCNRNKWEDWPSENEIKEGIKYLNPCVDDYDVHFRLNNEVFLLEACSKSAEYMINHIRLNRDSLKDLREERYLNVILNKEIEDIKILISKDIAEQKPINPIIREKIILIQNIHQKLEELRSIDNSNDVK